MDWRDHITVDPRILVGKPVVKGTRISVEMVVDLLAAGWTHEQILDSHPTLKAVSVGDSVAEGLDKPFQRRHAPADSNAAPTVARRR